MSTAKTSDVVGSGNSGQLSFSSPSGIRATKNVLALLVNAVAAIVFILVAEIDWTVAGLIALGSVIGGQIGAGVGRRLPPVLLRAVIAVVGVVALVALLA